MANSLTPFVYWAQTINKISLKVDLAHVKDVDVHVEEKKLKFSANGEGARGLNQYSFSINFHSELDAENSSYKISERQIDFSLIKKAPERWPRLTSTPQKPSWLKVDFDKWSNDDGDEQETEESVRDIHQDYPETYDNLHKEEFGYKKGKDFKKVYLIFYSLFQCIGFMYILSVIAIRYYKDGPDSMKDTYEYVGNPMKFIQILQFLEVMHPLFGYTDNSPMVPLLQVGGRAFILFCMIEAEPRMQSKPVIFYVFLAWSSVEVVRYPYYISRLFKVDIGILTWLRYTVWMPLYPLGFLCEGIIVLRNIPYFEETNRFTINLPNSWNFAFHFPTFLRLYLILLCLPGMYFMMSYMNKQRRKKLMKVKIKKL